MKDSGQVRSSYGTTSGNQPTFTTSSSNPFENGDEQKFSDDYYKGNPELANQRMLPEGGVYDPRPKNWPPCRPIVLLDIPREIPAHYVTQLRQALVGWYFHSFALFYNFICMFGAIVKGEGIAGFFISIAALVLGVPISFWVYWLYYSAVRQNSSFMMVLHFITFALQIAAQIWFIIGIDGYGAAGFGMMIKSFDSNHVVLGIMFVISTFIWAIVCLYSIYNFNKARKVYSAMGGNQAATKEFSKHAAQTAYDNRGTIIQVAKDNKETIKEVAYENKDVIIDFAKDNREAIGKAAYDNKDTLYENREAVSSIFDSK